MYNKMPEWSEYVDMAPDILDFGKTAGKYVKRWIENLSVYEFSSNRRRIAGVFGWLR